MQCDENLPESHQEKEKDYERRGDLLIKRKKI